VPFVVKHGDRIAQGELMKNLDYTIEECYTAPLQKTDRVGGFGSTGVST
jgi:dUTPase